MTNRAAVRRTVYECRICGNVRTEWSVQCTRCGSMGADGYSSHRPVRRQWPPRLTIRFQAPGNDDAVPSVPVGSIAFGHVRPMRLIDVKPSVWRRLPTGQPIDRVTGGGFVAGKLYALRGASGIGKNRLSLPSAVRLCTHGRVLWVSVPSAEEHQRDVRRCLDEMGLAAAPHVHRLEIIEEADAERLAAFLAEPRRARIVFVVVDSLSTLHAGAAAPPSMDAVRRATRVLREVAGARQIAILGLFHETNEGHMAGGAFLRHLVHMVLRMERVAAVPAAEGQPVRYALTEERSDLVCLASDGKSRGASATEAVVYRHESAGLVALE